MIQAHAYHCEGDTGAQPLHCHEEVEFVAVYQGQGIFQCGHARHGTGLGVLSIACPQEAHGGSPVNLDFAVRVLNVPCEWFESAGLNWRSLWRKEAVCETSSALSAFLSAYEAVQGNGSHLRQEESLLALFEAASERQDVSEPQCVARLDQSILLMRDCFTEELSLTDLAAVAGLTPAYFCRAFKKAVGLPPHAYQNTLRVARAKSLLEKGAIAGEVAVEVGFYDQSHFIAHFKRLLGVTPAVISREAISSYKVRRQPR